MVEKWHRLFEYRDGHLYWKISPRQSVPKGMRAGSRSKRGYVGVGIETKRNVKVHRIIWEMHFGPIPEGKFIDHINRKTDDNRIENLRLCTHSQNVMNQTPKKNMYKFKGVCIDRRVSKGFKRFFARIGVGRQRLNLGYFETPEEAALAYNAAAAKYHGEFAVYNEVDCG